VKRARQGGAALLVAMLVAALVATAATASLWGQWRDAEVEAAERARVQSTWLLNGALDWARLILRDDAATGPSDHLDEPWAMPLQEARLSAFLGDSGPGNAFLSGRIADLQSRINVSNIAALGRVSEPALRSFERLFELLGLPQHELARMAENLRRASDIGPDSAMAGTAPPSPQCMDDLAAMGLSPATIAALERYVTVLPGKTPVNLNTASTEVLYSAIDGVLMDDAQRLAAERTRSPFGAVADAARLLPGGRELAAADFSVGSRFFEVRGRLRMDQVTVEDRSIVQRDGSDVVVLQRSRTHRE
jgi:general secretion pathway protein K